MTIDDKTGDQKLQYDLNREAAKISTLSSGKIINMNILQVKKYYLLIQEEWWDKISLLISFRKSFGKKKPKAIEEQGIKQIKAIASQNKRLTALTNKDDYKDNYIKTLEELVKKQIWWNKVLTYKINILKVIMLEKDFMISIIVENFLKI